MTRKCPACGMAAEAGDRYCSDCGSARDRSAWVEGRPDQMADAPMGRDSQLPDYETHEQRQRRLRAEEEDRL